MKKYLLLGIFLGGLLLTMVISGGAIRTQAVSEHPRGIVQNSEYGSAKIQLSSHQTVSNTIEINEPQRSIHESESQMGINTEIGSDFRLSSMGPDGNASYDALLPAVAYNSTNNQYLVVWSGSDDVIGEYEIWGQRVNAETGAQISADFQISFMGPIDDPDFDATDPDVAYNSTNNEYLVVWEGEHYADGDFEIFARRVNAATGELRGSMVRVSVMGPGVDANYDAQDPAVVYNSTDNQYLVVWEGDDDTAPLVNGEFEIWGRRLNASAEWLDATQIRVSDMHGSGDAAYDAYNPDVAYNSSSNDYMVVWYGDDSSSSYTEDEYEIWGQRLNAAGGAMGFSDFRISELGDNNDPDVDARDPAIAYNPNTNQYLVVWEGNAISPTLFDIFGQRLEANGVSTGDNDFYISHPGVGPNSNYSAYNPAVAVDKVNNEFLVVWQDDEMGADEFEIWGQRLSASSGAEVDSNQRLSDMGPEGEANYIAQTPAIAYSGGGNNQFLIVWSGDNTTDGEFEIWSQRFSNGFKIFLPIVIR